MTNPYIMGQAYPKNNFYNKNFYQSDFNSQPSIFSTVIGAGSVGFAGGAITSAGIDLYKNRKPVNNGQVSDSFAKNVMNKIIDKEYSVKGKEFFKQKSELLKKLDKIKSPEEFTKLMTKYKKYASSLCDGISLDSMCKTVTKDNLKGKISALKSRIESSFEPELRNIKDIIKLCWNKEDKKFVKPNVVEKRLFEAIKDTRNSVQWKKMLKYGGITAGIFGGVTLVYSMLMNKANSQINLENNTNYNV